MKDTFEINLPMQQVHEKLLQSDGLFSGYNHQFETEAKKSGEIKLLLFHSQRLKPKRRLRRRTRIRLIPSERLTTTYLKVDKYHPLFLGFWAVFLSGLFILPIVNTPRTPYFLMFFTFLIIGAWVVSGFNLMNSYFLYQILHQVFDDKQWTWLGHPREHPKKNRYLLNRVIEFEIESIHGLDDTIALLYDFPNRIGINKRNKLQIRQKDKHIVLMNYVKNKSNYVMKHRMDVHIYELSGVTVVVGQSMLEPIFQSSAVLGGVFILMFVSLFWVYTGLQTQFLPFLVLIGLSTIFWWRDAWKQQDKLLNKLKLLLTQKSKNTT